MYYNYPQLTAYSKSSPSNQYPGGGGSAGTSGGDHDGSGGGSGARSLLVSCSGEDRLVTILVMAALSCLSFFRLFQVYLPWITVLVLLLLIGRRPKEKEDGFREFGGRAV